MLVGWLRCHLPQTTGGASPIIRISGACPASLSIPAGEGRWPGAIMFPDAGGMRDTMHQMGGRIAAAASFHGGNLAEAENPDSPHQMASGIKAAVYVAGAIEDQSFPDEQKNRLEMALTEAGVVHTIETYQAHHGFAVPDFPSFDASAAERHWEAIEQFFGSVLGH